MSSHFTLTIAHPEPIRESFRLIPVFLPFAGCRTRCIFCDQHAQTGQKNHDFGQIAEELEQRLDEESPPFGIGFYGGTFTGLSGSWQERFLKIAARQRKRGRLMHVRASTRPDTCTPEWLGHLQSLGLDMLELGVQSFDRPVLEKSRRGYDCRIATEACKMVRDAGMALGIQLLPGLPGHTGIQWREDVARSLALEPEVVRMYPCLVMSGTELARMFERGEFVPWDLATTVLELSWATLRFWQQGIRVIRMGVPSDAQASIVAGPWHPSFGNMVRSLVLLRLLEDQLHVHAGRIRRVVLPRRLSGELWGAGRVNAAALAALGITRETVVFDERSDIFVELE